MHLFSGPDANALVLYVCTDISLMFAVTQGSKSHSAERDVKQGGRTARDGAQYKGVSSTAVRFREAARGKGTLEPPERDVVAKQRVAAG